MVGVGLAVALLASLPGGPARVLPWRAVVPGKGLAGGLVALSARILPGGSTGVLPCGPARVLPWRAVVPGKGLAGGLVAFLSKDLAEDRCLLILS